MTRANQIKSAFNNNEMTYSELLEEASDVAVDSEQDFDTESTTFTFADGSVAVFSSLDLSISAYGSN